MKKHFLLFATLFCALLSSCTKEDSKKSQETDPTPSTTVERTIDFIFVSSKSQQALFENVFKFEFNGTIVEFKESDMTEVTDVATNKIYEHLVTIVNKGVEFMDGTKPEITPLYLKYNLGKLKQGETVKAVSKTTVTKTVQPAPEHFNYFEIFTIMADDHDEALKTEVSYHKQVIYSDATITSFFNLINKNFTPSYTCH